MSSFVERLDNVSRAAELWNKGYNYAEIGRSLNVSPIQAKGLIQDYKELLKQSVEEDPDFLARVKENTLEALDEYKLAQKVAWEAIESAQNEDDVPLRDITGLLKLASDLTTKKAQLHQLLGTSATSSSDITKLKRLEQVNEIISSVLKEIISQCDHCRREAQIKIAQAFQLMDKGSEIAELKPVPEDIEDAEIVVDHSELKSSMMDDIISGD